MADRARFLDLAFRKVSTAFSFSPEPRCVVLDGGLLEIVGRKAYGLAAKAPNGARLEALIFQARKSGRRIRATNWPVGRIKSVLVRDVLQAYADASDPSAEEKAAKIGHTRRSYLSGERAFQAAFPDLEIGDTGDWIPQKYSLRALRLWLVE